MKTKIIPFLSLFLLLAAFVVPAGTAHANSADVKIALTASPSFPGAKGTAKYRNRSGERELQVEAEVARRFAGTVFRVVVDGNVVGQMTINAFGVGKLSLNTKQGQAVPNIVPGSVVTVTTSAGGLVLNGKF